MEQDKLQTILFAAAQDVFSTMLGMEVEAKGDGFAADGGTEERVVSLIGIAGTYIGTGMLGCSPRLACQISSTMLMGEYGDVNSEVLDAMGEMANMIFGNVKTALEDQVGPLGLSVPTVVFGRNFSTRSGGTQPWIDVPLLCEGQKVEVRFSIGPNTGMTSAYRNGFRRECTLA